MENNIRNLIKEVLDSGHLMSLATVDDGGVWVADVIYIFDDDFNIYWMSRPHRRHSTAIMKNPKVAGTITVSKPGETDLGIQFEGIAEVIKDERHDLLIKYFQKKKKPLPEEIKNVLDEHFWYLLKPKKIELIYEKLFGFDKQKLEL